MLTTARSRHDELFGKDWEREQWERDNGIEDATLDDYEFDYEVELPDLEESPYCGRHRPNDAFDHIDFVQELWQRATKCNEDIVEEQRRFRVEPEEWLTQEERERAWHEGV